MTPPQLPPPDHPEGQSGSQDRPLSEKIATKFLEEGGMQIVTSLMLVKKREIGIKFIELDKSDEVFF